MRKSWEGHAADTQMCQERAAALRAPLQQSPTPRYVVADSTLSTEDHAATLKALGFLTRIPNTLTLVSPVITHARREDPWQSLTDTSRSHRIAWCHDGMAQRWLVVSSQAALERAEASVNTAQQREAEVSVTQRLHVPAQRCETPEAAHTARAALAPSGRDHPVATARLIAHTPSARTGRPTPTTPITSTAWQRHAQGRPDHARMTSRQPHEAGCVVGTHMAPSPLSDPEVLQASKAHAQAEGGFRCLQDPLFFVSSLFVKTPCRLQGWLRVMTCALLVYAVTQRRLRQQWARHNETVPHQMHQPTARPTLRWVFQLLEGIPRVRLTVQGQVYDLIEGLNEVQIKMLRLFGDQVCRLYQISPG